MAHGFITPQAAGDNRGFDGIGWLNKKLGITDKLKDELSKLLRNKAKKSGLVSVDKGPAFAYERNDTNGVNVRDVTDKPAARMLKGTAAGLLKEGSGAITKSQTPALPSGGPSKPGRSFVNMPGVSAAPTPLNADTFFKRAATGTGAGGEYLSTDDRKSLFAQSKSMRASDGDSGVDIVSAVNQVTSAIVNLQSTEQKSSTDNVRALARLNSAIEEREVEKGEDLSGFLTPENARKKDKQEEKKDKQTPISPFVRPPQLPGSPFGAGGALGGGGLSLPTSDPFEQWRSMPNNKKTTDKIMRRGPERAGRRAAIQLGGKDGAKSLGNVAKPLAETMGKPAQKAVAKTIGKNVAETGAKTLGKSVLKKIPFIGALTGVGLGIQRLISGDPLGAVGEVASGVASTVPGVGTGISVGIDAALGAKDMMQPETALAKGGIVTQPTTALIGDNPQNPFSKTGQSEGVFPLEGKEGKATFENFGEGLLKARKDNPRESAEMDADGLEQFFDKEKGFDRLVKKMKDAGIGSGSPASETDPNDPNNGGSGDANEQQLTESLIAGEEGFRGDAYKDSVGKWTIGYGQTTIDGRAVKQGDKMSKEQAVAGLRTNIKSHRDVAISQVGQEKWDKLDPKVRASLTSVAYNYGSLPDRIMPAVKTGDSKKISDSLSLLHGDNGGDLKGRRQRESSVINTGTSDKLDKDFMSGGKYAVADGGGSITGGGGGGSASIANAAKSLKGMDTSGGPGGGGTSCVYAVNKVFAKAGVKPPWGGAQSTDAVINATRRAGWKEVGFGEAKPGDLWAYDANDGKSGHVGVMMPNGKVLSNSSSKGAFVWEADRSALLSQYPKNGMTPPGGVFFRPPGGGSTAAAPAARPGATTASSGGGGSSPRISAAPGSPAPGPGIAAASNQVALGSTTAAGGSTTNNYFTGGSKSGGNTNSPSSLPIGNSASQISPGWAHEILSARLVG